MKLVTSATVVFALLISFNYCTQKEVSTMSAAESFLQVKPDSSLILLKRIDPSTLATRRQKAKYALLLSAALDKNYIDVTSDSLISIALNYFSRKTESRDQLLSWYYNGIVLKNAGMYPPAVVSFEKAATIAGKLQDSHQLGLIYRNIASSFDQSNNIPAAIQYLEKAVSCFSINPADSLYHIYALCSLATEYTVNRDYAQAKQVLSSLNGTSNKTIIGLRDALAAEISIKHDKDYKKGISEYMAVPEYLLSMVDFINIAYAYSVEGEHDLADMWLKKGYSAAKNQPDSATIDYTKSLILFNRGRAAEAFPLLKNATSTQDSLTRALLSDSVSSAQRDYFREEALKEKVKSLENRNISIVLGLLGVFAAIMAYLILSHKSREKDRHLKDLMAQQVINNRSIVQLSKDNASLLSTHYSERIRQIDKISNQYFNADTKTQKEVIFRHFKDYIQSINDDNVFYDSLYNDLDKYSNGIMSKLRAQVPRINGRNQKIIAMFFSGLSYETVAILTKAPSANSLKTLKSRLRDMIKESDAADKTFFLEMLDMKKPQARKTKE